MDSMNNSLNSLKITCTIHNSEIGGVCDNLDCVSKNQIMCIKCVSDQNSCIRINKHKSISISEYITKYFTLDLKSFSQDKDFQNTVLFLSKPDQVISNYHTNMKHIRESICSTYENLLETIGNQFTEFKENFSKITLENEEKLKESLNVLNKLTNFSDLGNLDKNKLYEKILKSQPNYLTMNNTITQTKKTYNNIKLKSLTTNAEYIENVNTLGELITQSTNQLKDNLKNYADVQARIIEVNSNFSNYLKHELFKNSNTSCDIKRLNDLTLKKEFNVDSSVNSNFINKKFTVFQHSVEKDLIAYPLSNNTINLDYFDLSESCEKTTPFKPFFNLKSHASKIIDIIYYKMNTIENKEKDILITSSEDKSIKVWDITMLSKYLTNVNEYYKLNCVKTLLGHENRIQCLQIFFNPILSKHYLISLGYGDRYKVWDIDHCSLIKDLVDCYFNSDTFFNVFNCKQDLGNYMISYNHNGFTRLWNFDTGKIIAKKQINNNSSKISSALNYDEKYDKFLLIDEASNVYLIEILCDLKCSKLNGLKIVASSSSVIAKFLIPWEENIYFVANSSGMFWEIDKKIEDAGTSVKLNANNLSFAMKYRHHNYKNIIVTHSFDQKIRIFI